MLALKQVSVINDLKGGNAETRRSSRENHGAALGQRPGSSRDIHNNIPLSSAGTRAHSQVEDGITMVTLQTSID